MAVNKTMCLLTIESSAKRLAEWGKEQGITDPNFTVDVNAIKLMTAELISQLELPYFVRRAEREGSQR